MENAEEILQCLDEFAKLRPKEIPPELEYYLSFVARTGDPVYQWPLIKCLFREKLINVITEFYEACPSVEIPPCPNVEIFNYEAMKGFILEKLDTFAAAPFTVQRICELLTSPRKEYNRIDKYMRALEKNILVVSTREPGNRKSTENGESVVNGLEEHNEQEQEMNSMNSDINVEVDMDEKTVWHKSYETDTEASNIILETTSISTSTSTLTTVAASASASTLQIQEAYVSDSKTESVITSRQINYIGYTNEIITTTTETETEAEAAEIEAEAEAEHEDTTEQPQHLEVVENSEFSSSLTTTTSKDTNPEELQSKAAEEEEHIYVTETVNKEADCSQQMETTPIICAETEPITPPEPEASETTSDNTSENTTSSSILEAANSKPQSQQEEPIVESSSEVEAAISSSEEVTKVSETKDKQEEVSASDDHQDVVSESSSSSCIIGPEDMQVEDISPEPETKDTVVTKQDQPETKEESVIVEPEVTGVTEEQPLKTDDKSTEEVKSVTETAAVTENVTETETETDKETENN